MTSAVPTPNETASTIVGECSFAHCSISPMAALAESGRTMQKARAVIGSAYQMAL